MRLSRFKNTNPTFCLYFSRRFKTFEFRCGPLGLAMYYG